MIVYRNGQTLTLCDRCYRPRVTDEEGWTIGIERQPYRDTDAVVTGDGAPRLHDVPVDYCPDCATRPQRA